LKQGFEPRRKRIEGSNRGYNLDFSGQLQRGEPPTPRFAVPVEFVGVLIPSLAAPAISAGF
jgi:hypothetical protein